MPSQILTLTTRRQHEVACSRAWSGLQGARIPPPLSLSEWADKHFRIGLDRWDTLPFQRAIMDAISNDDIRIIDWPKSAQIGYTKIITAAAGYFTAEKHRPCVIYQPTKGDAEEFCQEEIDPMFESVETCSEALARGARGKTGDKLSLKNVDGAMLYIRGGHSPRAYRRLTVDTVIYDDLDGFEREIGTEGDPVTLGDNRITTSLYPKSIRGSTPRRKGDSLIFDEVDRAALVLKYHVHCLHCDVAQTLKFAQMKWDKRQAKTVRYQCEHCGGAWGYPDLYPMLEGGYWGTDDGEHRVIDGDLVDVDGQVIDWPRHIAFWIWAAYSVFFSWEDLIEEWLEAQGDPRKLQAFTNTRLAEVYDEDGEELEPDELPGRNEPYTRPPAGVRGVLAGVDVQQEYLQYELVGYGNGSESWGIEYGAVYGDPTQPEVWNDLTEVLAQTFHTEDGREIPIKGCAIDSGFLADHVYAYYKRKRGRVGTCRLYVTKGASETDGEHELVRAPHERKTGKSKAGVPLFMVGTHSGKSLLFHRLALEEPGSGYCHFPNTYDDEYFAQLTAEKKVKRKRRGRDYPIWIKTRTRNEALDIRVLTYVALAIWSPKWMRDQSPASQSTEEAAESKQKQTKNPHELPSRRVRRGKKGFVNSWR